jgi:hypothetical protein
MTQASNLEQLSQLLIFTHFQKFLPEYVTLSSLLWLEDRNSSTGRHKQIEKPWVCTPTLEADHRGRKPAVDLFCKCFHSHVVSNHNFRLDSKYFRFFFFFALSVSHQLWNERRKGAWMAFNPATSEPLLSGCRGPWFNLDLLDFHTFWHI